MAVAKKIADKPESGVAEAPELDDAAKEGALADPSEDASEVAETKQAEFDAAAEKAAKAAEAAAKRSKNVELAFPAPSQMKGLPEGVNGGPATIDNPPVVEKKD